MDYKRKRESTLLYILFSLFFFMIFFCLVISSRSASLDSKHKEYLHFDQNIVFKISAVILVFCIIAATVIVFCVMKYLLRELSARKQLKGMIPEKKERKLGELRSPTGRSNSCSQITTYFETHGQNNHSNSHCEIMKLLTQ